MGAFQFGIYVYVWTWVVLLASLVDFGLAGASQRFIPEYTRQGNPELLRGFHAGTRWITLGISVAMAIAAALAVKLAQPLFNDYEIAPLYLACLALPIYGLLNLQAGIARAHNWVQLSQLPTYVLRQLLLIVLMGVAYFAALRADAVTAVVISVATVWIITLGQFLVLNRRLATKIEPGAKSYRVGNWLSTSFPMFMMEGFYLLLTYCDVLLLQMFQTPHDIAVYYAADKTLALIAFVHYAVTQTSAHRFSQHHFAGDRAKLATELSNAIRLTFWPSLAATVLVLIAGIPLLWLFGPEFVAGYPLMFILSIGLLSRAAVGPLATFLNMIGQQRACAGVFAAAFVTNFTLCLLLIPLWGTIGAAMSTATALIVESTALFFLAKRRLGFHSLIWGAPDDGKTAA
jgi:O-antigen/teichoic acid export membrane protein